MAYLRPSSAAPAPAARGIVSDADVDDVIALFRLSYELARRGAQPSADSAAAAEVPST